MFSKIQKRVSKSFKKAADFIGGTSPPLKQLRQALISGDDQAAMSIYTCRQYTAEHDPDGNNVIACLQETLNPSELFPFTHQGDQTPLHLAAENAMEGILVLFLENGGDPNACNGRGETCLHALCSRNERPQTRLRLFEILVAWRGKLPDTAAGGEEGETVSINRVDTSGNSALHFAASNGLTHLVIRLLEQGAIISIVNRAQQTCCELVDSMAAYKHLADILEVALVYQPQSQDACVFEEFLRPSSSSGTNDSSPRFGTSNSGKFGELSSATADGYDLHSTSAGARAREGYCRQVVANAIRCHLLSPSESSNGNGNGNGAGNAGSMTLLTDTVLSTRGDHFTAAASVSVTSYEVGLFIQRAVELVVNYSTLMAQALNGQGGSRGGNNNNTTTTTAIAAVNKLYDITAVAAVGMLGHYNYNVVALIHDLLNSPEQVEQQCKASLMARTDESSTSSSSSSSGSGSGSSTEVGANSLCTTYVAQMITFVSAAEVETHVAVVSEPEPTSAIQPIGDVAQEAAAAVPVAVGDVQLGVECGHGTTTPVVADTTTATASDSNSNSNSSSHNVHPAAAAAAAVAETVPLECGICGDGIDICVSAEIQLRWSTRLQQRRSLGLALDSEMAEYLQIKEAFAILCRGDADASAIAAALTTLSVKPANSSDPVVAIQCLSSPQTSDATEGAHTYCTTCWRSYLTIQIHEQRCGELHCPGFKCTQCLDSDYWGGLLFPPPSVDESVRDERIATEGVAGISAGEDVDTGAGDGGGVCDYMRLMKESRLQTAVDTCDFFHPCSHSHTRVQANGEVPAVSPGHPGELCGLVVCTDSLPVYMLACSDDEATGAPWFNNSKFQSCLARKYRHHERMLKNRSRKIATNCRGGTTPVELGAALRSVAQSWPRTVICANSHALCTSCGMEAHAPCPCGDWGRWQNKIGIAIQTASANSNASTGQQADIANALWVAANTKKCPKCSLPIEKDDGCNHMVCHKCKHEFCWICMQEWGLHNNETGGYFQCNRFVESTTAGGAGADGADGGDDSDDEPELGPDGKILRNANDVAYHSRVRNNIMARFIHHFSRYSAHSESGEKERRLKVVAIQRLRDTLLLSSNQSKEHLNLAVVSIYSPSGTAGAHKQMVSGSAGRGEGGFSTPPRARPGYPFSTPSSAFSTPSSATRRPSLLHSLSSAFSGSPAYGSTSGSGMKKGKGKKAPGEDSDADSDSSGGAGAGAGSSTSKRALFAVKLLTPEPEMGDCLPCSPAEVVVVASSVLGDVQNHCSAHNAASEPMRALPWLQGTKETNPFDGLLDTAIVNPPSVSRKGRDAGTDATAAAVPAFHLDLQTHPAIYFLIHAFDELYACRQCLRGSYAYAFYAFKNTSDAGLMYSRFVAPPSGRSTHMHHFYPNVRGGSGGGFAYRGGGAFRADFQAIARYKELFERLQAELEMTTEILSDVVARARLRATRTHIVAATSRAAIKRREFEACVFGYWENVAFNTVAQNLGDPQGEGAKGAYNGRDESAFSIGVRDRERDRRRRRAELERERGLELDGEDDLINRYSRRGAGSSSRHLHHRRRDVPLSPPSDGGSVDAMLEHVRRMAAAQSGVPRVNQGGGIGSGSGSDNDFGHDSGELTVDHIHRGRRWGGHTAQIGEGGGDDDDFDIAAAIGWIEQLTASQSGNAEDGGSADNTENTANSRSSVRIRSSIRPRNQQEGGESASVGDGELDLDFSSLLSPQRAADADADADDNGDGEGEAVDVPDPDNLSPPQESEGRGTVPGESSSGGDGGSDDIGDTGDVTDVLSLLSADEREHLALAVSARRSRPVEIDEFNSNPRLLAALSATEQRRLVAMLRDSGRIGAVVGQSPSAAPAAATATSTGGGTVSGRDRRRISGGGTGSSGGGQPERSRLNRLQAAASATPTDSTLSPPRPPVGEVTARSQSQQSQQQTSRSRSSQRHAAAHNDRLLRIALRMEEEEAMERAILMSLQPPPPPTGDAAATAGGDVTGDGSNSMTTEGARADTAAGGGIAAVSLSVDENGLQLLISMGFEREASTAALLHCNNNVEQATERLCSGM